MFQLVAASVICLPKAGLPFWHCKGEGFEPQITKSHYILHSHGFSGIDEGVFTWVWVKSLFP